MKIYKFILILCISVIIAFIGWYYFVYNTFCLGYSISETNQSLILDIASSEILKSSSDDSSKKNMLNKVFENIPVKITVTTLSNNTLFYEKDIENSNKFIPQTLFVMTTHTDNNSYEVQCISYSKPKLIYAIKSVICMNKNLVQKTIRKQPNISALNLFDKIKKYYYNHILSIKFWLLAIFIMLIIYRTKNVKK